MLARHCNAGLRMRCRLLVPAKAIMGPRKRKKETME
jgi:hypothetical protein